MGNTQNEQNLVEQSEPTNPPVTPRDSNTNGDDLDVVRFTQRDMTRIGTRNKDEGRRSAVLQIAKDSGLGDDLTLEEIAKLVQLGHNHEQNQLSELERANNQIGVLQKDKAGLEARVKELELNLLRFEVGSENNLPRELWSMLQGDDKEALQANAETLAAFATNEAPKPKPPSYGGKEGSGTPSQQTLDDTDQRYKDSIAARFRINR